MVASRCKVMREICQTLEVRRSLGGLMLIIGAVLIAIAIGSWWLQRVAFSPSTDSGVTHSILGDENIRGQVASIVAAADAPILQQSPTQLKEFIEEIARIPDGAALMSRIVGDAHARLIGQNEELVLITADEQVTIVRNELVGEADSLTLPVQRVGSLAFLDEWLGWFAIGTAVLGVVFLLGGVILRPERGEGTFARSVSAWPPSLDRCSSSATSFHWQYCRPSPTTRGWACSPGSRTTTAISRCC